MNKVGRNISTTLMIVLGCLCMTNINGQNLTKHHWENRVLIVKAQTLESVKYHDQIKEFRNSVNELKERKLIIYQILGEKYRELNINQKDTSGEWKKIEKQNSQIWNEKEDFKVILIGLDGGVKLEKDEILRKEELFGRIDSMPMRKKELIRKKEN